MVEMDTCLNQLLALQRLENEGKDVSVLTREVEERVFEEADIRIDAFFRARRRSAEREYCAGRRYYLHERTT